MHTMCFVTPFVCSHFAFGHTLDLVILWIWSHSAFGHTLHLVIFCIWSHWTNKQKVTQSKSLQLCTLTLTPSSEKSKTLKRVTLCVRREKTSDPGSWKLFSKLRKIDSKVIKRLKNAETKLAFFWNRYSYVV